MAQYTHAAQKYMSWLDPPCLSQKSFHVLQNKILKSCTFKLRPYPTNELHRDLGILKIGDIHKNIHWKCPPLSTSMSIMIFCVQSNILSPCTSSNVHPCTRRNDLFHAVTRHGKLLSNKYCYKIWNLLPNDAKTSKTLATFKHIVKAHFITQHTTWDFCNIFPW